MTKNTLNAAGGAPKVAMSLYTKSKDIEAAVVRIHSAGQTLQTDMHVAACSIIQHLGKHKDVRLVNKLLQAMPEMSRQNSLIMWLEAFGNVVYSKDTKGFIMVPDKGIKLGEAIDKPFWKFKANEGVAYEAIDLQKLVESTVKLLKRDTEKTGRDHSVLVAAMKGAIAAPVSQ
jgi:hypothetical protein